VTFATPRRPTRIRMRRRSPLAVTLAVLVAVFVLVMILAQVWTEVLWYQQTGFFQVLRNEWVTRAILFVLGFLLMAGATGFALRLAYRSRPVYPPSSTEQATLDRYREQIEPLRRLAMTAGPVILGIFAGAAASSQWTDVLLFLNRVPFGKTDPQFGIDLSFFVFTLPVLRFIASFLMATTVLAVIGSLATHYLYGGIRITAEGDRLAAPAETGDRAEPAKRAGRITLTPRVTRAARFQLSCLAAFFLVLVAANYLLDRYSLLTKTGDRFDGAGYADVNAVMPSKTILAAAALFVAVLFIATAAGRTWRLPGIGVALMVVSAIVIGGIYPAVVQRFQVDPNAQELESPYIQRNIDATKAAFGLDNVEVAPYDASTQAQAGALRADAETTASIRLLDPAIVSPSFQQLQQNKQYYSFVDTLAVDRYVIDGKSRDTVIAVRELNLNGLSTDRRSWVNDTTVYTHGFGVVAAYGNTSTVDGQPAFYEGGIPPTGGLGTYEPRIYFGQESPAYSIVGAPAGTTPWELDYPADNAASGTGQVNTTYTGDGGPRIGNLWTKLLYSVKFGSEQILFSDRVTPQSQILYDRSPLDRVAKVAPYLTLDGMTYPAVVDGRVVWIVDGYTTSDAYPYSAQQSLDDATADSLTQRTSVAGLLPTQVNYLRNSVKATVDAYSGKVTLYTWDENDPVLKAWGKAFPGSLQPLSSISGNLMSHLRYPEDMFKVQRKLLATYHVTDAGSYYSGQDFWRNPNDPTVGEQRPQPPYYLTLQMPGQTAPTFSLTSTFIPGGNTNRNVLTGFLAVDAEPGNVTGKPREDYGKLRLLELPRNATVPGPGQVQNNFNSNPTVSTTLNLLRQGNSTVLNGNLLTLPVGGGLLYVQPVYVQSSAGTKFPLLQKVLVSFGDQIGFANTLGEALDQVFGGDSGATVSHGAPTAGATATPGQTPSPGATATPGTATPEQVAAKAKLATSLAAAKAALLEGQAALAKGDFAAYGAAQAKLQQAVDDAAAAQAVLGG